MSWKTGAALACTTPLSKNCKHWDVINIVFLVELKHRIILDTHKETIACQLKTWLHIKNSLLIMLIMLLVSHSSRPSRDAVLSVWSRFFLSTQKKCHILAILPYRRGLSTLPYYCLLHLFIASSSFGFYLFHHSITWALSVLSSVCLLEILMRGM